jgi:hypothetical protein
MFSQGRNNFDNKIPFLWRIVFEKSSVPAGIGTTSTLAE